MNIIIDNVIVKEHLNNCIQNNIDFLKIDSNDNMYRDELRIGKNLYCANPLNIKYSLNTAIAIWKSNPLYSLCVRVSQLGILKEKELTI